MSAARLLALGVVIGLAFTAGAQGQDEEAALSRKRLALMEQTIGSLIPRSGQIKEAAKLKMVTAPLLRYSDPTRGLTEQNVLIDATVWRIGEHGRPTALVTLEIYRTTAEAGILAYEFASCTEASFSVSRQGGQEISWNAAGSALSIKPLTGAPVPAKTLAGRLVQMRQLARRFAVRESVKGESVECRLLSAPIDRYRSQADEIEDGSLFAFANGTNPEVGLALECGPKGWNYGLVRLSAAEVAVQLDGREVIRYERVGDARLQHDFTSRTEPIALPN